MQTRRPRPENVKKKLSEAMKGNKNALGNHVPHPPFSEEHRRKLSQRYRGGSSNGNWRGGITPIHRAIRQTAKYFLWRKMVFERDGYTCVWCGDDRGGNLQADHIKPFATYPKLRFVLSNGRTLCRECHKKTPTYGASLNKQNR